MGCHRVSNTILERKFFNKPLLQQWKKEIMLQLLMRTFRICLDAVQNYKRIAKCK